MEAVEEHQEDGVDSALEEEVAAEVVEVSLEVEAVVSLLEVEEVREEDFPAVVDKSPFQSSILVAAFGLCMVFRAAYGLLPGFASKKSFCHTSS